ncbi:MAG TPA: hypothetical protein VFW23_09575 [Tepidisphaeraceae bacterium]|nr:hypothetical protein [Tepidisphaeraceae bacterium]
MRTKWFAVWAASAGGAHCIVWYLANTLDEVPQDIGWREVMGAVIITAMLVLIARLLLGKSAAAGDSMMLICVTILCAAAGAAVMLAIYSAPLFILPPFKSGP